MIVKKNLISVQFRLLQQAVLNFSDWSWYALLFVCNVEVCLCCSAYSPVWQLPVQHLCCRRWWTHNHGSVQTKGPSLTADPIWAPPSQTAEPAHLHTSLEEFSPQTPKQKIQNWCNSKQEKWRLLSKTSLWMRETLLLSEIQSAWINHSAERESKHAVVFSSEAKHRADVPFLLNSEYNIEYARKCLSM